MSFIGGCLIGLMVGIAIGTVLVSILAVGAAAERDMEWQAFVKRREGEK
jgi:hypothetical protein